MELWVVKKGILTETNIYKEQKKFDKKDGNISKQGKEVPEKSISGKRQKRDD